MSLKALLLLTVTVAVPVLFIFFNVTEAGGRIRGRLEKLRRHNQEESRNCAAFVKRVEEMFPARKERLRALVRRMSIRRMSIRSAARVAFTILNRDAFTDKQGALLEFAERHKFKDSMGRLGGAVWVGAALVYLILPPIPEVEMISAAAAMVLPVYYISMMIMDGIDEARGKALEDVAELIKAGVQPTASDNRSM